MTETPSPTMYRVNDSMDGWWFTEDRAKAEAIGAESGCPVEPFYDRAALDAARAEGEAKGRREALEEAARLCDASEARIMTKLRKLEKPNADLAGAAAVGGADTAEKLARRIRAMIDRETDQFSQPGKMAEGETDR